MLGPSGGGLAGFGEDGGSPGDRAGAPSPGVARARSVSTAGAAATPPVAAPAIGALAVDVAAPIDADAAPARAAAMPPPAAPPKAGPATAASRCTRSTALDAVRTGEP